MKRRGNNWRGGINSMKLNCFECGNFFLGKHTRKLCSRICYNKYRSRLYRGEKHPNWKGGISSTDKKCIFCKKLFTGYITKMYCNTICKGKHFSKIGKVRAQNNGMWKGGRNLDKDGYVLIKRDDCKSVCKSGYVREHRYIIEKKIGRKLRPYEIVHHKNGIKNDNHVENLQLLTKRQHDSLHVKKR